MVCHATYKLCRVKIHNRITRLFGTVSAPVKKSVSRYDYLNPYAVQISDHIDIEFCRKLVKMLNLLYLMQELSVIPQYAENR